MGWNRCTPPARPSRSNSTGLASCSWPIGWSPSVGSKMSGDAVRRARKNDIRPGVVRTWCLGRPGSGGARYDNCGGAAPGLWNGVRAHRPRHHARTDTPARPRQSSSAPGRLRHGREGDLEMGAFAGVRRRIAPDPRLGIGGRALQMEPDEPHGPVIRQRLDETCNIKIERNVHCSGRGVRRGSPWSRARSCAWRSRPTPPLRRRRDSRSRSSWPDSRALRPRDVQGERRGLDHDALRDLER